LIVSWAYNVGLVEKGKSHTSKRESRAFRLSHFFSFTHLIQLTLSPQII
jgi:hypothetical protein